MAKFLISICIFVASALLAGAPAWCAQDQAGNLDPEFSFKPTRFTSQATQGLPLLSGDDDVKPWGRFNPRKGGVEIRAGQIKATVLPLTGPNGYSAPAFLAEGTSETAEPYSGFMALHVAAGGPWGLTLGGGYARSLTNETNAGGGSGRIRQAMSTGSSAAGQSRAKETGESLNRWSAYLAVPYRITDNIGLRPEVSYYYEAQDGTGEGANEWVMGLQFNFGF